MASCETLAIGSQTISRDTLSSQVSTFAKRSNKIYIHRKQKCARNIAQTTEESLFRDSHDILYSADPLEIRRVISKKLWKFPLRCDATAPSHHTAGPDSAQRKRVTPKIMTSIMLMDWKWNNLTSNFAWKALSWLSICDIFITFLRRRSHEARETLTGFRDFNPNASWWRPLSLFHSILLSFAWTRSANIDNKLLIFHVFT